MKNAICREGTGNELGRANTNVVETCIALDTLRLGSHAEKNAHD